MGILQGGKVMELFEKILLSILAFVIGYVIAEIVREGK